MRWRVVSLILVICLWSEGAENFSLVSEKYDFPLRRIKKSDLFVYNVSQLQQALPSWIRKNGILSQKILELLKEVPSVYIECGLFKYHLLDGYKKFWGKYCRDEPVENQAKALVNLMLYHTSYILLFDEVCQKLDVSPAEIKNIVDLGSWSWLYAITYTKYFPTARSIVGIEINKLEAGLVFEEIKRIFGLPHFIRQIHMDIKNVSLRTPPDLITGFNLHLDPTDVEEKKYLEKKFERVLARISEMMEEKGESIFVISLSKAHYLDVLFTKALELTQFQKAERKNFIWSVYLYSRLFSLPPNDFMECAFRDVYFAKVKPQQIENLVKLFERLCSLRQQDKNNYKKLIGLFLKEKDNMWQQKFLKALIEDEYWERLQKVFSEVGEEKLEKAINKLVNRIEPIEDF